MCAKLPTSGVIPPALILMAGSAVSQIATEVINQLFDLLVIGIIESVQEGLRELGQDTRETFRQGARTGRGLS